MNTLLVQAYEWKIHNGQGSERSLAYHFKLPQFASGEICAQGSKKYVFVNIS